MGHAQHQQPQRADPEEVVSRGAGLLAGLPAGQWRQGAPPPGHLRQGAQEADRSVSVSVHLTTTTTTTNEDLYSALSPTRRLQKDTIKTTKHPKEKKKLYLFP